MTKLPLVLLALAACPKGNYSKKTIEPPQNGSGDAGRVLLPNDAAQAQRPPAPPLPEVPFGLPPVPAGVLEAITPEQVQTGGELFADARLSSDGKSSCATCHDPANHFVGKSGEPQLVNLAWNSAAIAKLPAHVADVMHRAIAAPDIAALSAFVVTRYSGDSVWDHLERGTPAKDDPIVLGYKLFNSKGCAVCHTPPLYTDLRSHDSGEGAKPTRGLRGVAQRSPLSFGGGRAAKTLAGS
ncbi:MAG TPA: cytochrome c peroxidase, partial [Kofleriaceae bacterium]